MQLGLIVQTDSLSLRGAAGRVSGSPMYLVTLRCRFSRSRCRISSSERRRNAAPISRVRAESVGANDGVSFCSKSRRAHHHHTTKSMHMNQILRSAQSLASVRTRRFAWHATKAASCSADSSFPSWADGVARHSHGSACAAGSRVSQRHWILFAMDTNVLGSPQTLFS